MGLINRLQESGSSYSKYNGTTPDKSNLASSKLHNTYSINGNPDLKLKQQPSVLDLNGNTPEKYIDKQI